MNQPLFNLSSRGLIQITGKESKSFLQRLITNDMTLLQDQPALYALLLNTQGRILHDFFIIKQSVGFLIEGRREVLPALLNRLNLYKLNAAVELQDISAAYCLVAGTGQVPLDQTGFYYQDPRHADLGFRGWIETNSSQKLLPEEEYRKICLTFGIPEEGYGMENGRTIPLEAGVQDLNAISWTKGCYVGQELIARTYHRGEIRKRFFPVTSKVPFLSQSTQITTSQGQAAGEIIYSLATQGIARLRLAFFKEPLFLGDIPLNISQPSWIHF